ncbi:MAG: THUMP domain-containing protein [Bacteroidales bacterium]|nr:THUMP domain-containing protein [Bacteroidales bacterium]
MIYTIVVKTLFGLEEVLVKELEVLGINDVKILRRAVEFQGDLSMVYKCNLHLRCALSVLVKIGQERVENEEQLYKYIYSIAWNDYFDLRQTIAVSVVTVSETMNHSLFLEQKTKDAVVDYFRDKFGDRPNVDIKNPDVKISIYLTDDTCNLYLDSSGQALYFRGFDKEIGEASINECLAAGIIQLSGWDLTGDFLDPMCGSGTFLTEAYMMARNMPAGISRKQFSFMNWNNFDSAEWKKILTQAKASICESKANIMGCDIDPEALRLSKINLYKLDKAHDVKIVASDFFTSKSLSEKGVIFSNPPYGTRMKLDDANDFYKKIGDKLKFDYAGYTAWIISSDMVAIKFVGMKPDKKWILYNGQLECRLHKYSIYSGSRKKQDYK